MMTGGMKTVTFAERPDLAERAWERTSDTIPEYNRHGDVLNVYWGRLDEERPEFQFYLLDDSDEILARAHTIPLRLGQERRRSAGWDRRRDRARLRGGRSECPLRDGDHGPAGSPRGAASARPPSRRCARLLAGMG